MPVSSQQATIVTSAAIEPKRFWPRELLVGLMLPVIGVQIMIWIFYLPIGLNGFADFRSLYTGAYMSRTGHASELYDQDRFREFEQTLVPLERTFIQPMDHPAYEELIFLPLSFFGYRIAFLVFVMVNVVVAAWCVWRTYPFFRVLAERWPPLPAFLFAAFFPITRSITQGQDSIFMLAFLVAALVAMHRQNDLKAGVLVGLAVFKFQVAIPIALLFLLWRRWSFVAGFGISSLVAAIVSVLWVGISGTKQYVALLLGMSVHLNVNNNPLRTSLSARTMLNLRGLTSVLFEPRVSHTWVQMLLVVASLIVLVLAARSRPSLPLAIIATSLVSYHLNAQDASPLIIPIGLALCSTSVLASMVAMGVLIFPFTALYPLYAYISAIPIIFLFITYLARHGTKAALSSEYA